MVSRHRFATREAARTAIFEYIEGFLQSDQEALPDWVHMSPADHEQVIAREVKAA